MTTGISTSLSAWYDDEALILSNTGTLTALQVTITVQNTQGVSYDGISNNIGSQITMGHSGLVYTFTLASGKTVSAGTGRRFDAEISGSGTVHVATGDTWAITYTTGGVNYQQSGNF